MINDTLGQGGFGITYQATDTSLSRPVAIKEFFPSGVERDTDGMTVSPTRTFPAARFESFRDGFVEEGKMLAALDHPAIVPVYRVFEENSTAYLVMKLLEGETLEAHFEAHSNSGGAEAGVGLPWSDAVTLIRSLEDVLTYLHSRDVLHRDIKPANLFRLASGQVVLLDFGAARGFASDQTQTMTYIGTSGFAPPEQSAKRARRGPFTDVYALSATLYYLLTGEAPIHSVIRLQEDTQPAPRELVPEIPEWLSNAVMRGLAPVATERPQTVTAFCTLLSTSDSAPEASRQTAATAVNLSPPTGSSRSEPPTAPVVTAPTPIISATGPTLAQLARLREGIRTLHKFGRYGQQIALSQVAVALHKFDPQEADAVFQEAVRFVEGASTKNSASDIDVGTIRRKVEALGTIAALWGRVNPQAAERVFRTALSLAESITGPTGVWKLLGRLGNSDKIAYDKTMLFAAVATDWSNLNPKRTKEIIDQATHLSKDIKQEHDRGTAERYIAIAWSRINLSEALRFVGTLSSPFEQHSALKEILKFWIKSDPQQALQAANAFPDNNRAGARIQAAQALAKTDLQTALRVADELDVNSKLLTLTRIAALQPDHASPEVRPIIQQALDLVRASPVQTSPEYLCDRARRLAEIAEVWASLSPEEARELFEEAYQTAFPVAFIPWKVSTLCHIANAWSKTDTQKSLSLLQQAMQLIDESSDRDHDSTLREIVRVWAKIDPAKAQTIAVRIQAAVWVAPALLDIAVAWSKRDRQVANRVFGQAFETAYSDNSALLYSMASIVNSWFIIDLDAELDYALRQPEEISLEFIRLMAAMLVDSPEDLITG